MADPEARAAEVLDAVPDYLWDGRTLPVPIEEIVDSQFRLKVGEFGDLRSVPGAPPLADDETLSGLLVVEEREIWVNAVEARKSPGRRRFTIGHELGHWVMHRDRTGKVFCRSHAVSLEASLAGEPDIEAEASLFSGALMFPSALVREQWESSGGDVAGMCERFGGSRAATERAVFRVVRRPAVLEVTDALECFFYDDERYEAWRSAHEQDGFIVNDDLGTGRLHHASCSYLRGALRGAPRTADAKWCSTDADELRRAFPRAKACTRCRP